MTMAALRLLDVTAGYPDHLVLRNASVTVAYGDFVGIAGPNGAGKTTLFKVVLGLIAPISGSVEVLGTTFHSPKQISAVRRQIGYVSQQNQAGKLPITVYDSVLLGRWGSSFRSWRRPTRTDRKAVEETLDTLHLSDYRKYDCRQLSGGLQQRVALARAVVRRPHLVLMDEPTTFLDQQTQSNIYHLADELNRSEGITFVIISHDQALLSQYAKRMLTISAGEIIETPCLNSLS